MFLFGIKIGIRDVLLELNFLITYYLINIKNKISGIDA